jgi:hypothetical protein
MNRQVILFILFIGAIPLLCGFKKPEENNNLLSIEYNYIFQLDGVNTPGDAKMANTNFIRSYFGKPANFIDENNKFEIVTGLDIEQANLENLCTLYGYSLTSFEKYTID